MVNKRQKGIMNTLSFPFGFAGALKRWLWTRNAGVAFLLWLIASILVGAQQPPIYKAPTPPAPVTPIDAQPAAPPAGQPAALAVAEAPPPSTPVPPPSA